MSNQNFIDYVKICGRSGNGGAGSHSFFRDNLNAKGGPDGGDGGKGGSVILKAEQNLNTLIDFTVVYATQKRSTWNFLCGDLSKAKVVAKTYAVPENLKNRSFEEEDDYRKSFQTFVDAIWLEKQQTFKDLKF